MTFCKDRAYKKGNTNVFSRTMYEQTVENVLDCSNALVKVPIKKTEKMDLFKKEIYTSFGALS